MNKMNTSKKILVLHGPNLNLVGTREPNIYGNHSLFQLNSELEEIAKDLNGTLVILQSNHEGILIDHIQKTSQNDIDFIIINAGAYTHTSIALRDALSSVSIPFIEVHLSNIKKREKFRHQSYLTDLAVGIIAGLGFEGYKAALRYALLEI